MRRKEFLKNIAVCIFSALVLASTFSSCTKETEKEKLWILTDFTGRLDLMGFDETSGGRLLSVLSYPGGLDTDQIELEFLPVDQTECSLRIQQLRTEIMAGGGPDVYILSSDFPAVALVEEGHAQAAKDGAYRNPERLFPDLQFAMKNKMFLPFDSYLETAEWLDLEQLLPIVRDAGQTEEGQMLLPITFTFPLAIYEKEAAGETYPASWNEALTSDVSAFRHACGNAAQFQFSDALGELVDCDKEALKFTKEELLRLVKETVAASKENLLEKAEDRESWLLEDTSDGLLSIFSVTYVWAASFFEEDNGGRQVLLPIRNQDRGVTAKITACAGINRNTKRPEEAFRVLDILSSEYGQCGKVAESPEGKRTQTLFFLSAYGVPARNDLLQSTELSFGGFYIRQTSLLKEDISRQVFAEYTALREEVTHARFYGALDQELQAMYEACLEAESDEEIEKIISKAYSTMEKMLAES